MDWPIPVVRSTLLVLGVITVFGTACSPDASGGTSPSSAGVLTTETVSGRMPVVVTAPPGVPTPYELVTRQEAIDYVLAMLEISEPPFEQYAARARQRDIMVLQGGPGARIVTPNTAVVDDAADLNTQSAGDALWIVGLHTVGGVPTWKLFDLAGIPHDSGGSMDFEGHEFYVVMDGIGNVVEGGFLDSEKADGEPFHAAPWQLVDIMSMPTADP